MSGAKYGAAIVMAVFFGSALIYVGISLLGRRRQDAARNIDMMNPNGQDIYGNRNGNGGLDGINLFGPCETMTKQELDRLFPARPLDSVVIDIVNEKCFGQMPAELTENSTNRSADTREKTNRICAAHEVGEMSDTNAEGIPQERNNTEENRNIHRHTDSAVTAFSISQSGDISDEAKIYQLAKELEQSIYDRDCAICQSSISLQDEDDFENENNNESNRGHQSQGHNEKDTSQQRKKNIMVRLLTCGHIFHDQCITIWLLKKPTCPMCKIWLKEDHVIQSQINQSSLIAV